jgi:hypothetical protein
MSWGRRIARMFLHNLKTWKDSSEMSSKEPPLARSLKSYAVFITDHTRKEDKSLIQSKRRAAYQSRKMKY